MIPLVSEENQSLTCKQAENSPQSNQIDSDGGVKDFVPQNWEIGTPLFFVPIRFWEEKEPRTGRVAELLDFHGGVLSNPTRDGFVYAFHDGYGHNVYMQRTDVFLTRDEAVAEIERRTVEQKAADDAEWAATWEAIKATLPTLRARNGGQ